MGRGSELGGHLGVDGDHHLLLLTHEGVALLHLVLDPGPELVAKHHGAHVHQPLLGHLGQVDIIGQEVVDVGLLRHEVEDVINGQALVLGHEQRLDLVVRHVRLAPGQHVLEEVDGHVI